MSAPGSRSFRAEADVNPVRGDVFLSMLGVTIPVRGDAQGMGCPAPVQAAAPASGYSWEVAPCLPAPIEAAARLP